MISSSEIARIVRDGEAYPVIERFRARALKRWMEQAAGLVPEDPDIDDAAVIASVLFALQFQPEIRPGVRRVLGLPKEGRRRGKEYAVSDLPDDSPAFFLARLYQKGHFDRPRALAALDVVLVDFYGEKYVPSKQETMERYLDDLVEYVVWQDDLKNALVRDYCDGDAQKLDAFLDCATGKKD